jgi:hypothetical protein
VVRRLACDRTDVMSTQCCYLFYMQVTFGSVAQVLLSEVHMLHDAVCIDVGFTNRLLSSAFAAPHIMCYGSSSSSAARRLCGSNYHRCCCGAVAAASGSEHAAAAAQHAVCWLHCSL